MTLTIAIVAGEASGDLLGASLMAALRAAFPDTTLEFIGVTGPRMLSAGCESLACIEQLSVMGLTEVLRHLPRLYRLQKQLRQQFLARSIDLFIGIDYQEFNFYLARYLHRHQIPTVQYVSPSVWAWRAGRVKKIKQAMDLMLCLFPFEVAFYEQHQLRAAYVGHPLADQLPLEPASEQFAQRSLGLKVDGAVVALLPGSRTGEINHHAALFLQAAALCYERDPTLQFVIALTTESKADVFRAACKAGSDKALLTRLPITWVIANSQTAMLAADAVLLASGTATLEAMLLKRPMVVAYKMSPLTYTLLRRLVVTKYIALPNVLADELLVPEFIQQAATPDTLATALLDVLTADNRQRLATRFLSLHQALQCDGAARAARAIKALLDEKETHLANNTG